MKKIEKILKYIENEHISISEFERKAGISNGYLSNTAKRGADVTSKILDKIEVNAKEHFDNIFPVNPKDRHINTRAHLKEIGESKNGIQVYESAPVQAGIRTVYHDEHEVPDYVLNIPQFRDCNYGTRASGDSMYPEIRNGDLIICKELPVDARIIFGDVYVIHTMDGIETIKYVHQFTDGTADDPWVLLVPHNKSAGMGTPIPRKEIIKLFKVRAIFKAY